MTAILFVVAVMFKRDNCIDIRDRTLHCRWHRCYSNISY